MGDDDPMCREEYSEADTAPSSFGGSATSLKSFRKVPGLPSKDRGGRMTSSFMQKDYLGPPPGLGSVVICRPKSDELLNLGEYSVFRVQGRERIGVAPTAIMPPNAFYVEVDGTKIPAGFSPENLRSAVKYQPLSDDIFICTFPKCGTNWAKRIVQLLIDRESRTGEAADYGLSKCFLEMAGADVISSQPRPRIVTSHLYYGIIPKNVKTKYIYILRNPKDCCVSYFHHTQRTKVYDYGSGSFSDFLKRFLDGETSFGCYFEHFRQWYSQKEKTNVLFLTYENMKRDPITSIQRIVAFLELSCPELSDPNSAKFKHVLKESGIDAMKDYVKENYQVALGGAAEGEWKSRSDYPCERAPPPPDCFVRKGVVGDWKNHFSVSDSQAIELKMLEACRDIGAKVEEIWRDEDWKQF